jgi:drug/metabolite transporter (DMT)-like permease
MSKSGHLWTAAAPAVFVLLWSTGYVGARLGLPHAEPFIFLTMRFSILAVLLVAAGLIWRAPWPTNWAQAGHLMVTGLLLQGFYLGGIFWAISNGISSGIAALIVGIQPLLTAVAAGPYLGEKVSVRQWTGLLLGFGGVALVVGDDLGFNGGNGASVLSCIISLCGITLGTLYQKRHGGSMDLRTGSAIQFAAAAVAMLVMTLLFEEGRIDWTAEFIFAISWLVVVLSIGAMTLLYLLIRQGAASQVASLFYLVPPVVAVEAYFLFDETMTLTDITGMAVVMAAVALVMRKKA